MFTYDGKSDLKFLLGWDFASLDPHKFFSIFIGCGLTACFISMGSKFWHDMLDMLFYAKNLKEKLVDAETYKINNLKKRVAYIETEYYEMAQACLEQNKDKIEGLANIVDSFVGFNSHLPDAKPVIILNSSLKSGGSYPTSFSAQLSTGHITVEVVVIYDYEMPTIQFGSGDNVFEQNHAQVNGTICCALRGKNKNYFLTCAHVLTGGINKIKPANKKGWISNPIIDDSCSNNNDGNPFGTWSYGLIDGFYDIALIEINPDTEPVINEINQFEADSKNQTRKGICVNGNINKKSGFVISYKKDSTEFKYNGSTHHLKNLLVLSKNLTEPFKSLTIGGDSGAIVYLINEKKALGMVVGGNSQYTFAIPLAGILEETETTLT
jgi:V8-like Glu-specific endopeptidase